MPIKVIYDNATGQTWVARLLNIGDRYGLNDCLVVTEQSLVEFYDSRYPHTDLGQFVSRYHTETLLDRDAYAGLQLAGGVPSWRLSSDAFAQVHVWLAQHVTPALA